MQKEVSTGKPRTITLKLSDTDCERIAKKAGECSLTVAELLEGFIGDLVGGDHAHGSDERDCACRWFERCGFPCRKTFSVYLLLKNQEGGFLEDYTDAENIREDISYYKKLECPDEDEKDELKYLEGDLLEAEKRLGEYYSGYAAWCGDVKPQTQDEAFRDFLKWQCGLDQLKGR